MQWYKGNIHCHTSNSDGDLAPKDVADLYKRGGYDFICITDHNHVTDPSEADTGDDNFLVIPGIEFTYNNIGSSYIHVNAIGFPTDGTIPETPRDLIQGMRDVVELANNSGCFSVINHPNWDWGYGAEEMAQVPTAHAFEIYNGAPTCNNHRDSNHPSTDKIWDSLLSRSIRILGVASDDAHHYTIANPTYAEPPFTSWICVRAESLTRDAIMRSLFKGDFYASNHPILKTMTLASERLAIEIEPVGQIRYTTTFVGRSGGSVARRARGRCNG